MCEGRFQDSLANTVLVRDGKGEGLAEGRRLICTLSISISRPVL